MLQSEIAAIEFRLGSSRDGPDEWQSDNPDWDISSIVQKTGIWQTWVARPEETALDLAEDACGKLLDRGARADVDALMQATDLDELMSPADIAVLRGLLKAVQQDTSLNERLDAFIDTHCHEFVSYSASEHCEHKLEWVSCLSNAPCPVAPRPAETNATNAAVHAVRRPRCTRSTPR